MDLDGDGNSTLPGDGTADYTTSIFKGHGDDGTPPPFVHDFAVLPSATVRDVDGDGVLDLVYLDADGFSVSLGYGDGTFRRPHTYAVLFSRDGSFPGIASVDVDHDGHTDVAVPRSACAPGRSASLHDDRRVAPALGRDQRRLDPSSHEQPLERAP